MEWLSQQRQSQSQLTPSCAGPKGFSTVGATRRGVENAFRAWQSMHLLTDFSLSASAAASFPLGRLSLSGFLSLLSQSIYLYVDTYLSLWPTPPSFFLFFFFCSWFPFNWFHIPYAWFIWIHFHICPNGIEVKFGWLVVETEEAFYEMTFIVFVNERIYPGKGIKKCMLGIKTMIVIFSRV